MKAEIYIETGGLNVNNFTNYTAMSLFFPTDERVIVSLIDDNILISLVVLGDDENITHLIGQQILPHKEWIVAVQKALNSATLAENL